ncbi:hypothetical protein CI109_101864 [Kwoniella shandongensis]|uniref:Uncharacterized protein n=1 Tax=Kwoniella shandongensis TaxID=1734106 RepID=A0A5M6BPE9_9TREE|nr:uncharacterized protein CI109_007058 [Kwoniella shandongensis]KAA5524623.1 hypothetical protein CI109_007058 [Kwoniella shandongensis]
MLDNDNNNGGGSGNGDVPSATPLDLLINAIAGSTDYNFPPPPEHEQNETRENDEAHLGTVEGENDDGEVQSINLDGLLAARKVPAEQPGTLSYSLKTASERHREVASSSSQRQLGKVIAARVIDSLPMHQTNNSSSRSFEPPISTVEVWHPTTGQKSYGKERRILNPPPILRVTGAVLPTITSVTLSTIPNPPLTPAPSSSASATPSVSGSQTHRIIPAQLDTSLAPEVPIHQGKRAERLDRKRKLRDAALNAGFGATLPKIRSGIEGRDRDALREGLTFPGLWVGEDAGKGKEFVLQLKLEQEGSKESTADGVISEIAEEHPAAEAVAEKEEIPLAPTPTIDHPFEPPNDGFPDVDEVHESSLVDMLGSSSMEVLQPLAEAVRQAGNDHNETLAGHLGSITTPNNETGQESNVKIAPGEASRITVSKPAADRTLATLVSTTLKIVSKPSQKTAKARSMASCLSTKSSFALWTRIHGQTVRTKYMKLETDEDGNDPRLTSKTGKWTPFKFEIIHRAVPQSEKASRDRLGAVGYDDDRLTYGSIVSLVDLQSGTKSDPVKLVKVESGEVRIAENEGDPVSELQRIGLVRMVNWAEDLTGGARWYLSAPGARMGGAEVAGQSSSRSRPIRIKAKPSPVVARTSILTQPTDPPATLNGAVTELAPSMEEQPFPMMLDEPATGLGQIPQPDSTAQASLHETEESVEPPMKKKKTKRNALAIAVVAEDEDGGVQALLSWSKAGRAERPMDGPNGDGMGQRTVLVEKVEDWMCWIIGGVSCFSTSFFSTSDASIAVPSHPIDPVPQILVPPVFHPDKNTLDLTISEFFFSDSADPTRPREPLEVYLGPLGPLHLTVWQSNARRTRPSDNNGYINPEYAGPYFDNSPHSAEQSVLSAYPKDINHVIVVVEMPGPEDIIKAMQHGVAQAALEKLASRAEHGGAQESSGKSVVQDQQDMSSGLEGSVQATETPWSDENAQRPSNDISNKPSSETRGQEEVRGNDDQQPAEMAIAEALSMADNDFSSLHHLGPFDADIEAEAEPETEQPPTLQSHENLLDPSLRDHTRDTSMDAETAETQAEFAVVPIEAAITQDTEPQDLRQTSASSNHEIGISTTQQQLERNESPPEMLNLYVPAKVEKPTQSQTEMMPLPLLLLRKNDGVAFGTGRSVVAQRLDGDLIGEGIGAEGSGSAGAGTRWGLRVVET